MIRHDKILFQKVSQTHLKTILLWLREPHMTEFWDNSQEHKDDIINFVNGRVEPSNYFNGIFTYWVGMIENEIFSFILTSEVDINEDIPQIWKDHVSTSGKTYTLDFAIGNTSFLGKGLASPTLSAFTEFFKREVDPKTDTFFIDPDDINTRAQHVYKKAGFNLVGEFNAEKKYWNFDGEKTYLMVKKMG